jgi:hypothetical protein
MRRRCPNPRLAKSLRTYDVAEVARLYGCHRNTVRHWFKQGLKPIDDGRPTVILGKLLNDFHAARRAAGKRPCGPGEIYCAPCRKPQRPAGGMVDIEPFRPNVWKVTGIRPGCDRLLHQRVGAARLTHFQSIACVGATKPHKRIGETSASSVNCDLDEDESEG